MNLRRGITRALICLCLAVSVAACANQISSPPQSIPAPAAPAPPPPPPVSAAPETSAKPSKTVKASYQGASTAGRPTASGEPYDPKALTAASRTLPIGSTVKVTNPDTGASVKVRINDRGPFVHGRSLDLSKSAAEKIGITDKGVAKVKVAPASSHPGADQSELPSAAGTPAP